MSIWRPFLIMSVSLFPYLPLGLRIEHVLVPMVIFLSVLFSSFRINKNIGVLSIVLLSTLPIFCISSLSSATSGLYSTQTIMLVRLTMPALMLIAFGLLLRDSNRVFYFSIESIVTISATISIASIAPLIWPGFNDIIAPWIINEAESVWSHSIQDGRSVGIFNQPLEAGIFFSVALLASVVHLKLSHRYLFFDYLRYFLIFFGGVVSLSKVFLVLGLFLAISLSLSLRMLSFRTVFVFIILIGVLFSVLFEIRPLYFSSLVDLYYEGGVSYALTAGRLGGATENMQLYEAVSKDFNWIFGFGLGSYLPLDSGYLEYYYQGGVGALLGYMGFIIATLCSSIRRWNVVQGKLLLFLGVLIAAGSIGGPVITASRANIAVILLLVSSLVKAKNSSQFEHGVLS